MATMATRGDLNLHLLEALVTQSMNSPSTHGWKISFLDLLHLQIQIREIITAEIQADKQAKIEKRLMEELRDNDAKLGVASQPSNSNVMPQWERADLQATQPPLPEQTPFQKIQEKANMIEEELKTLRKWISIEERKTNATST